MRLLVSGSTRSVRDLAGEWPHRLGHLLTPRNRNSIDSLLATGLPWGADNGCYSGFDRDWFDAYLDRIAHQPRCLFVVTPGVVSDARATLASFFFWRIRVAMAGQPIALVGQDGAEDLDIPWGDFDAWFIGGSTAWKLSHASLDLAQAAKRRGKHVHMGRVNSRIRMEAAALMGCDSVDGSSASMFGDKYIGKYCRWLEHITHQPLLECVRCGPTELDSGRRD